MSDSAVAEIKFGPATEATVSDPLIRRDMSLLGHVNVKLEVVLGSTQVRVDKLFGLSKGDSLELDTHLDGQVTLQLEGRSIARGKLVAVGDNFGLQITEIV